MNVVPYHQAVSQGFPFHEYSYTATVLGRGTYLAKLVLKVWAKNAMAISCFFDIEHSGEKIQLTVYCNTIGHVYRLDNSAVDFSNCALQERYAINIAHDRNGRLRMTAAKRV